MTVRYQGSEVETSAATLAAFLAERGAPDDALVECDGEIVLRDAAQTLPMDGVKSVNAYRIVAGG